MLITLRLPRTSAMKLGLQIAGTGQREVVVTMTAVELAGRLSLATGKAIGLEAVVDYCVAWRAASENLAGLVKKHGKTDLPRMARKACKDRALWAPRTNVAMLSWLQCVLEAHYLSGGRRGPAVPRREACATEEQGACDGKLAPEPELAQALADICETYFPLAYHLWTATVAWAARPSAPCRVK